MFATVSPKLAEANDSNKFTAKNLYQNTRQGFHSRFQNRDFQAGNLGATFATISPKLAEANDSNKFTAKNAYQNTRRGFMRDFRAEIFKQVTWGQCLQPYRPNFLK